MVLRPTPIIGGYLIDVERRSDERGYFARAWCLRELHDQGIHANFVQANIGHTRKKGTIRGLHFQTVPHEEAKLVVCTRGAVYDVMADMRPSSPSYGAWFGCELTEADHQMVYVPAGCAHGYQALADDSNVYYLVSAYYVPEAEIGIRYDDPALNIDWPADVTGVSDKDRSWPDLVLERMNPDVEPLAQSQFA